MKNPGIYILTCPCGKQYIGRDCSLPARSNKHLSGKSPKCPAIHAAIKKYGREAFTVETIAYPGISDKALYAVEAWYIAKHDAYNNGYNKSIGGAGMDSETSSRVQRRRVKDGTHNFLGSENNRRRVEAGTHHFLNGEFHRRNNLKRVADGTHPFLGNKNPVHRQIADGTHHFLDGEFHRRNALKRVEAGMHHFLGGEIARETNHRRVEAGTHNFMGDNNPNRKKRLKATWMWVRSLAMCWYEMHDYVMKRRAEFYSQVIPDMSDAEQLELF